MYIGTTFCNLWVRELIDNIFDTYSIPDDIRDLCYETGKLLPCKACLNKREYKKFRKEMTLLWKYVK